MNSLFYFSFLSTRLKLCLEKSQDPSTHQGAIFTEGLSTTTPQRNIEQQVGLNYMQKAKTTDSHALDILLISAMQLLSSEANSKRQQYLLI